MTNIRHLGRGHEAPAVFVDWVTVTQRHKGGGLPILVDGVCVWHDRNGLVRSERTSATSVTGSHDTAIRVGCDGGRVYLSGNVGRFSREDNLFNFGWAGTWARCNRVLLGVGLPPFSSSPGFSDEDKQFGARVSRLDITANFATGNEGQARAVIRWLSGQAIARVKRGQAGDESMWWSNTRKMFKAYLKGVELMKHGMSEDEVVVAWCKRLGIVRVEVELKRRLLRELGLQQAEDITDEKLMRVFEEHTEILRRVDRSDEPDILAHLPARSRVYAAAWLKGQDLTLMCHRATLFRHAKVLREYGIDILTPRNVIDFPIKVRVVDLQPVSAPDWYRRQMKAG